MARYIDLDRINPWRCPRSIAQVREWLFDLPVEDVVSKDVYEQVKWERDAALDTLREHGLELGERPGVVQMNEKIRLKVLDVLVDADTPPWVIDNVLNVLADARPVSGGAT